MEQCMNLVLIAHNMANVENCPMLEVVSLPKNTKEESIEIFSNKALRGKPYLDIDRTINEGVSAYVEKDTNTKEV
ncbi:hypothetical protein [Bacillus sp. 1P02SD]|uniref:hypothetical protein n=1 Tax=Bacillus sp. 1P02SD TaxID=3132264 RepID=UPI0039A2D4A6